MNPLPLCKRGGGGRWANPPTEHPSGGEGEIHVVFTMFVAAASYTQHGCWLASDGLCKRLASLPGFGSGWGVRSQMKAMGESLLH